MKLLIIGHSVVDHIISGNKEIIKPGGIYYSAIGFNGVRKDDDEFFLLTSSSNEDEKYFKRLFNEFNLDFVNHLEKIPHVNLTVDDQFERREHYQNLVEPLKLDEKIKWIEFDGVFVNMITGNDLTAEDFIQIRKNFDGIIYLDVHTLSRGVGKEHHRYFKKIPNYEKYLQSVDIIQVNEHELKTITPYDEKNEIIKKVFEYDVKFIIITKGERGAEIFTKGSSFFSVDAIKVNSINKVGCGDVFGSVFFYLYLCGLNFEKSLIKANYTAGIITTYSSENEFLNLKNDII